MPTHKVVLDACFHIQHEYCSTVMVGSPRQHAVSIPITACTVVQCFDLSEL